MVDTVRKVEHFSTMVPDQPGQAFKVLSTLVSAGVDLLACTGTQRGRRAQIEVVPDDSTKLRRAARKAGLEFEARRTGYLIRGKDRPGALASHLAKLAAKQVNVTGIDALTAGRGRWGAIIWVDPDDVTTATRVLHARVR
ncbi:MAG: hypothetical protein WCE38_19885 [Burkholderiales bacterium]